MKGGKLENLEKTLARNTRTNNTLNPGLTDGRQALSPLRHPCSSS